MSATQPSPTDPRVDAAPGADKASPEPAVPPQPRSARTVVPSPMTSADSDDARSPDAPEDQPDYWHFAQTAAAHITREYPEANITATRMFVSLQRATSAVIYDFESSIHRPAGGTWSSYRLLFTLWVTGPLTPHRIAEVTGMSRAAVSNLASTLEERGLIVKQASPKDGRSLILHLTDEGEERIREVFTRQNHREDQWGAALTEQESELLISLLDKLMAQRTVIDARVRR